MICLMLMQYAKMILREMIVIGNILRCMVNILMEDCIREDVKVVEEFVYDEVTKVEIDNEEFLGSFTNFFDRGLNNDYVGFYKLIMFKMLMLILVGFMRLFWYHKSITKNYSINC